LLRSFSEGHSLAIPPVIEVIGPGAFTNAVFREIVFESVCFESGKRLKEIGEAAFACCEGLEAFTVPSSVVTIGDRCFVSCKSMTKVRFEGLPRLKRIGERAFSDSGLTSITIPASVEKIAGSAFMGCPLREIAVARGSRKFIVKGHLLLTSRGTEIVRYFGRELEVIVPKKVEILQRSCFEACHHVERVRFEKASKLRRMGRSAISTCSSLQTISIPASVEVIEEEAFIWCTGLEACLIARTANLVRIGQSAFSGCRSLRSFYVPLCVEVIGENCFQNCISLRQVRFASAESLNRLIGDSTLDEALKRFGIDEITSLLRIEIGDGGGPHFEFRGWSSVRDGRSHLTLVQDIA
jgi:hypothetical protein